MKTSTVQALLGFLARSKTVHPKEGTSEDGVDETDDLCSECDGAADSNKAAEDSVQDVADDVDCNSHDRVDLVCGRLRRLLLRPNRMKVAFKVGHATTRMHRLSKKRKTRTSFFQFQEIVKSLTSSESISSTEEPQGQQISTFMSEGSFWRGEARIKKPVVAEIAFDSETAPYCIVSDKASPERLCRCVMLEEWGLANPKLILSIMGGAGKMNLHHHKFDIDNFSKGLVEAALRTGAWVTTGGTKSGVMDIVGQAMRAHDKQRLVPCIGICAFGSLKPDWREVLQSGSDSHQLVDHSMMRLENENEASKLLPAIQEDHTHFIICDNDQEGVQAFGSEVQLRAGVEAFLGTGSSGSVMILVNGGKISLKSVLDFIDLGCPVVVCRGTGRVADLIGTLVERIAVMQNFDDEYESAVNEHMANERESLTEEDRQKTKKIVESGQVEVYTINKRFEDVVLKAVLSNPTTRTRIAVSLPNQLMLAVQWGCTDYFDTLGQQLVQEHGGASGMGASRAIEVIFKELAGIWRSLLTMDRIHEVHEGSGALVSWLTKNHRKQLERLEVTEATLGKIEWQKLDLGRSWRSLEGLMIWCIEHDAPASVLETIWMHMDDPVHAGLVAASACRDRSTNKYGSTTYSDTVAKANLNGIADRFERLAVLLMEELAATGKGVEYLFQESDRYKGYTCFQLAHHLACKKFVSATFYRLAVDLYMRTPVPFSIKKEQLGVEYLSPWNLFWLLCNPHELDFSLSDLLSIPHIQIFTHGISRCFLIILYSYFVFYGLARRRGLSFEKSLLFLWALGFGKAELSQLRQIGSFRAYILDFWNFLDALQISLLLGALTVGLNLPEDSGGFERALEVVHAINLIPTWLRIGQLQLLHQELGMLSFTMGSLCSDAIHFLVLVIIVCLGFSCALTPMLFQGASRDSQGISWAFWTIVGCIDEKAFDKLQDNMAGPLTAFLTHSLFYMLVLVSNVLLVNLLIAVMNSTYERNKLNSQTEWAFHRVHMVLEFDEWGDLPPPLNLLEMFMQLFKRLPLPALFWQCSGDEDSDDEPKARVLKQELVINQRDLKDSQQKAIIAVGLDEDAGETALLRTENVELRKKNAELTKRKEELEGLAVKSLMEKGGLPMRPTKTGMSLPSRSMSQWVTGSESSEQNLSEISESKHARELLSQASAHRQSPTCFPCWTWMSRFPSAIKSQGSDSSEQNLSPKSSFDVATSPGRPDAGALQQQVASPPCAAQAFDKSFLNCCFTRGSS